MVCSRADCMDVGEPVSASRLATCPDVSKFSRSECSESIYVYVFLLSAGMSSSARTKIIAMALSTKSSKNTDQSEIAGSAYTECGVKVADGNNAATSPHEPSKTVARIP